MYTEYYPVHTEKSLLQKKNLKIYWKENLMNYEKPKQEMVEKTNLEAARLADRALFLLSFKDTPSQNLHHVLKVLGIHSVEEKKSILQEIFRLIREGVVYVPRGLHLLIDQGLENIEDITKIDLVLLQPYDQLIAEIQRDISVFND